jgi:glycosyltransferase involved in cell wall biosynthesis
MTGVVAEPRNALAAADVLLLPSRTEGVPSAPLEAGLLGIPSVVTRVGGAPTTVDDGRSGIVVPAGDPDTMAAALVRVLADATSMGRAARKHVCATFDIPATAAAWSRLCEEVVSTG